MRARDLAVEYETVGLDTDALEAARLMAQHRLPALLGADLGGNATAIGASANVVVLGIAERNRQPITFWQFTKYGLIVTAVTVAFALAYVWLRYFALA